MVKKGIQSDDDNKEELNDIPARIEGSLTKKKDCGNAEFIPWRDCDEEKIAVEEKEVKENENKEAVTENMDVQDAPAHTAYKVVDSDDIELAMEQELEMQTEN